jgi:hypothetical protein
MQLMYRRVGYSLFGHGTEEVVTPTVPTTTIG